MDAAVVPLLLLAVAVLLRQRLRPLPVPRPRQLCAPHPQLPPPPRRRPSIHHRGARRARPRQRPWSR
ncbi:hypothetical protein PAHAL_5G018400 [Panicum hallii]|uniref:Uncharacterized protein n=1 Tax=Panicum hallii TaxID=206008 RepID=A0A2T8IIL1_9POAL|nr:hypothetical protein PAHAL_5G018400 [Panicum hallii]